MSHPLSIPHILDAIVADLGLRHVYKAMRVCRAWYIAFQTPAWKNYTFNRRDEKALAKHGRFVQILTVYKPNDLDMDMIAAYCPSLVELRMELGSLSLGSLEGCVPQLSHLRVLEIDKLSTSLEQLALAPLTLLTGLEHFRLKGLYNHFYYPTHVSHVSRVNGNMLLRILNASAATLKTIKLVKIQIALDTICPPPPGTQITPKSTARSGFWSRLTGSSQQETTSRQDTKCNPPSNKWKTLVPLLDPVSLQPLRLVDASTYADEIVKQHPKEPWRRFLPSSQPQFTEEGQAEVDRVTAPLDPEAPHWMQLESVEFSGVCEHFSFLYELTRRAPRMSNLAILHSGMHVHGFESYGFSDLQSLCLEGTGSHGVVPVFDRLFKGNFTLRELHLACYPLSLAQVESIPLDIQNNLTALSIQFSSELGLSQLWGVLKRGFPKLTRLFIENGRWPRMSDAFSTPWLCAPHLQSFGIVDNSTGGSPPDDDTFLLLWAGMTQVKHLRLGINQLQYFHWWLVGRGDTERPLQMTDDAFDQPGDGEDLQCSDRNPQIFESVECLDLWYSSPSLLMLQEIKRIVGVLPRLRTIRYRAQVPFSTAAWNWLRECRPDIHVSHIGRIRM